MRSSKPGQKAVKESSLQSKAVSAGALSPERCIAALSKISWQDESGKTYQLSTEAGKHGWNCVRSAQGKTQPFTLRFDEQSGFIWWGSWSYFFDPREVGAKPVAVKWYGANDLKKTKPKFLWKPSGQGAPVSEPSCPSVSATAKVKSVGPSQKKPSRGWGKPDDDLKDLEMPPGLDDEDSLTKDDFPPGLDVAEVDTSANELEPNQEVSESETFTPSSDETDMLPPGLDVSASALVAQADASQKKPSCGQGKADVDLEDLQIPPGLDGRAADLTRDGFTANSDMAEVETPTAELQPNQEANESETLTPDSHATDMAPPGLDVAAALTACTETEPLAAPISVDSNHAVKSMSPQMVVSDRMPELPRWDNDEPAIVKLPLGTEGPCEASSPLGLSSPRKVGGNSKDEEVRAKHIAQANVQLKEANEALAKANEMLKGWHGSGLGQMVAREAQAQQWWSYDQYWPTSWPAPITQPGDLVCFHNMASEPELNGQYGTVAAWDEPKTQWAVQLASGEWKYASPDNLICVRNDSYQPYGCQSWDSWCGMDSVPPTKSKPKAACEKVRKLPRGSNTSESTTASVSSGSRSRCNSDVSGDATELSGLGSAMMKNIPKDCSGPMVLELFDAGGNKIDWFDIVLEDDNVDFLLAEDRDRFQCHFGKSANVQVAKAKVRARC